MTLTLDELHEFVMFEADEFGIEMIEAAIAYRRKLDLRGSSTPDSAPSDKQKLIDPGDRNFKVGDTVMWNNRTSPQHLRGLTAEVKKVNNTTVTVQVPNELRYRRFSNKKVRAQKASLDKVI